MASNLANFFALALLAGKALASDSERGLFGQSQVASAEAACAVFQRAYPNITYGTNTSEYTIENQDYFTSAAWLGPACVFAPSSTEQMSLAVKTLESLRVPFALRGGGHMPIANAANINSTGVLLSALNLNQLKLSDDKKSVAVGPGNRWHSVYEYLEPYGLTIVGGRMGVVGVPGLLLGGGISFFSNQYGWASDNIVSFTCVLACGTIVKATATNQFSDLFWALKGGGNSFAIVTEFEQQTYYKPAVTVGQRAWGSGTEVMNQFLDSVYDFAINGGANDPKAAITPIVRWGPTQGNITYNAMLFYDSNNTAPDALKNFSAPVLPPQTDTFSTRSMYQWTKESDDGFDQIHGFRQKFYVVSLYANRESMQIVHDLFFSAAQKELSGIANFFAGVAFMPIVKSYIEAGEAKGGNPQGVDASKAPYIWVEESLMWTDPADDAKIDAFVTSINADINAALKAKGFQTAPFLYLNDADADQPVFEGYPVENVQRLKQIRAKYDPGMVFTKLMPGGWKVEKA